MQTTRLPIAEQVFGSNKAPIAEVLKADFGFLETEVEALIQQAAKLPAVIKGDEDLGKYGEAVTAIRALSKRIDGERSSEGKPLLEAKRELDAYFNALVSRINAVRLDLEQGATDYQRAVAAEQRRKAEEEARKLREREEEERRKADEARTAAGAANAEGRAEQLASRAERAEEAAAGSAADLVRTRVGGVTASAKTVWTFRITDYAALQATLGPLGPFLPREDVEKAVRSAVRIQKGGTSIPGVEAYEDIQATFRK